MASTLLYPIRLFNLQFKGICNLSLTPTYLVALVHEYFFSAIYSHHHSFLKAVLLKPLLCPELSKRVIFVSSSRLLSCLSEAGTTSWTSLIFPMAQVQETFQRIVIDWLSWALKWRHKIDLIQNLTLGDIAGFTKGQVEKADRERWIDLTEQYCEGERGMRPGFKSSSHHLLVMWGWARATPSSGTKHSKGED